MGVPREAEQLARLYAEEPRQLVVLLSAQLGVVKGQTQMLLGLCGLAITVTGFSGAHMIRAGSTAAVCMVAGILLVLVGLLLCLRTLAQIRWVSQELEDDLVQSVVRVIDHRDRQQRNTTAAGVFVALGLSAYLAAVIIAALVSGNAA
jgi:hypothetical protein